MKRYTNSYEEFLRLNESDSMENPNLPNGKLHKEYNPIYGREVSLVTGKDDAKYIREVCLMARNLLEGEHRIAKRNSNSGLIFITPYGNSFEGEEFHMIDLNEIEEDTYYDIGVFPEEYSEGLREDAIIDGIIPLRVKYDSRGETWPEIIPESGIVEGIFSRLTGNLQSDAEIVSNEVDSVIKKLEWSMRRSRKAANLFGI